MGRAILFSTGTLCLLAAFVGFRLGQQKLHFHDATGVIEAVAAQHVETYGGTATECLGWLNDAGDLLNVRCGAMLYQVTPFGRITEIMEDGA